MANIYYPLFETGIWSQCSWSSLGRREGGGGITIPRWKIKCYVRASVCFLDQKDGNLTRWTVCILMHSLEQEVLGLLSWTKTGRSMQQFEIITSWQILDQFIGLFFLPNTKRGQCIGLGRSHRFVNKVQDEWFSCRVWMPCRNLKLVLRQGNIYQLSNSISHHSIKFWQQ